MLDQSVIIKMCANQLETDALESSDSITVKWLSEKLGLYSSQLSLTQDQLESVEKIFRQKIEVLVDVRDTSILDTDEEQVHWLTDERIKLNNKYYWTRFARNFKAKNIPKNIFDRTNKDTDKILTRIGDPESDKGFKCRGMVIGDVQSGKTNNYSALINKAADYGYKLIIVLTGTVEDLRQQTQERLDNDFVGSVSIAGKKGKDRETKIIGVGKADNSRLPFCLTDKDDDIKKDPRHRISTISEPILVVTKKNKHPLTRLNTWLSSTLNAKNGLVEEPVLIIDDEADNASVNTGNEDEDPKTINRLIRQILGSCKRSSYVAYTATPFANIFIHPDSEADTLDQDDLFPKDFIVALEPPNNYCGARFFFRTEYSESICQIIADADSHLPISHKAGISIVSIPESLKEAIGAFLLAAATKDIRRRKGVINGTHDSMLINMSRLTTVQSDIAPFVEEAMESYWDAIEAVGVTPGSWKNSSTAKLLRDIWVKHYQGVAEESWEDVWVSLSKMEKPSIVTVHSKSPDNLEYESDGPKKIIAIGGLKLSRGLTLEGLVVSYFYRRSVMYDSLMQMGRWYGYRDNYQDLLKLWLTDESWDWYSHISEASDDLREQAAEMMKRKMTPRQFGLRVKSSPDALMVTAANKMRTAKAVNARVRFDDRLLETDCVDSRDEIIAKNLNEFNSFMESIKNKANERLDHPEHYSAHIKLTGIQFEDVIPCLRNLVNHPSCGPWAENHLFLQYLLERSVDELAVWDVFVWQPKNDRGGNWQSPTNPEAIYKRNKRSVVVGSPRNPDNKHELRLNRKQHIVDNRSVEGLGLTNQEFSELIGDKKPKDISGTQYRNCREKNRNRPSLIFHLIKAEFPDGKEKTVLGWAISIPPSSHDQPDISYQVTVDWYNKFVASISNEDES
ncbi:Z1 domain-containing protein [Biformimicrobium ophioploci]|uniref:Z1 domain-containing protein n=1 Tax=Biformimicrobium ophioploci TaxID=3036711 RepID=A0ABQ6LW08_9GAMM|nr:Z1 domain-containing protein [Microbulbifer sp. NKW57]GMG86265.1 Z1 domain-containing protein [Microbulbifer sp. NKW57]